MTEHLGTCVQCGGEFLYVGNRKLKCPVCRRPKATWSDIKAKRWNDLGKPLGPRHQAIADLVVEGHANKEIAARVHLAEGTVKVYLCEIFERLGVHTRTELAALEIRRLRALLEEFTDPLAG